MVARKVKNLKEECTGIIYHLGFTIDQLKMGILRKCHEIKWDDTPLDSEFIAELGALRYLTIGALIDQIHTDRLNVNIDPGSTLGTKLRTQIFEPLFPGESIETWEEVGKLFKV